MNANVIWRLCFIWMRNMFGQRFTRSVYWILAKLSARILSWHPEISTVYVLKSFFESDFIPGFDKITLTIILKTDRLAEREHFETKSSAFLRYIDLLSFCVLEKTWASHCNLGRRYFLEINRRNWVDIHGNHWEIPLPPSTLYEQRFMRIFHIRRAIMAFMGAYNGQLWGKRHVVIRAEAFSSISLLSKTILMREQGFAPLNRDSAILEIAAKTTDPLIVQALHSIHKLSTHLSCPNETLDRNLRIDEWPF